MPIYDRPTKELMRDFAREVLQPGQVFQKGDAVTWFRDRYPKIRPTTVQMHVESMAINSGARLHHSAIKPGSGYDFFFKVASGRFRLWDPKTDPAPLYRGETSSTTLIQPPMADDDEAEIDQQQGSSEFAYERDLRNYLSKNLHLLEPGLTLYKDEDGEFTGVEFPVGGRFIDILAVDADSGFVVIELKVSRGYDRVVGQLLRYIGWVKKNMAAKRVRGVIVASEITEDLKLAASLITDVSLFRYELALRLSPVPTA